MTMTGGTTVETASTTRIAILEDQSFMRQSLSDLLQDAGFQVVGQYCDPTAFLSRLPLDQPQVAIIDLGLQGRVLSVEEVGNRLTDRVNLVDLLSSRPSLL